MGRLTRRIAEHTVQTLHTGNMLNRASKPDVVVFGMCKSAAAHMIWGLSVAYEPQGFKFYFVDERQAEGGPTIPVSGESAAEMYVQLAEYQNQGPWNFTFVRGRGYVEQTGAPSQLPDESQLPKNR